MPEPHDGVVLVVVETNGDPWAYTAGTLGGQPDWVQPDGDPLGWSEFGAGCCPDGERWMLVRVAQPVAPECGCDRWAWERDRGRAYMRFRSPFGLELGASVWAFRGSRWIVGYSSPGVGYDGGEFVTQADAEAAAVETLRGLIGPTWVRVRVTDIEGGAR